MLLLLSLLIIIRLKNKIQNLKIKKIMIICKIIIKHVIFQKILHNKKLEKHS
jgi:hypothetical protein